jgi:hypothetical protein
VAFTPQSKDFQQAIQAAGIDLEALLQSSLMQHTALSEGDWISVNVPSLDDAVLGAFFQYKEPSTEPKPATSTSRVAEQHPRSFLPVSTH